MTVGGLSFLEAAVSQAVQGSHETDSEPPLRPYAQQG